MKKGTAGLLLGIAAIMGGLEHPMYDDDPTSKRGKNPLRPEDINLNTKKIIPKGCQVYNINGVEIIAINEKSAIKKYNKKINNGTKFIV
jgi:hypothetical protein